MTLLEFTVIILIFSLLQVYFVSVSLDRSVIPVFRSVVPFAALEVVISG